MILEFCGSNYSLLRVKAATEQEMGLIRRTVSAYVQRFKRGRNGWDGYIDFVWYIEPYYYVPAGCWMRFMALREPNEKELRPAYDVQFENADNFFNKDITSEAIDAFMQTLNPEFPDISDQVNVITSILFYRMSSHQIATGFGKTYVCYGLSQYIAKTFEGKTLMIVPRTALVEQGVKDFRNYMQRIDESERLNVYGICGGFRNNCSLESADVVIGTFQSLVNYPDDVMEMFYCVIVDEGHTAKAVSVKDTVSRCINAEITTAISGTLAYMDPADALTIETVCGPIILEYYAKEQIDKGRLPRVAMQPIVLRHSTGKEMYHALLQTERLPVPSRGIDPEKASTYRRMEFEFLWNCEPMLEYIKQLIKPLVDDDRNVLVIFKNVAPAVNLFESIKVSGGKAHLIIGATDRVTRSEIKAQIERESGWVLVATDGVMSMGVSINNLHGLVLCMIGKSPHVTLQGLGRMLRNHPDKYDITVCYDIANDIRGFDATSYDLGNAKTRASYYRKEQYPVLKGWTIDI